MNDLRWNSVWSMGVPDVDDQHKLMLGILKSLGESKAIYENRDAALISLRKFQENTKQHFIYEEALLIKAHYPETDGHKADHAAYLEAVEDAINSLAGLANDDPRVGETVIRIRNDLQTLFTEHLVTFDMDYKWFLRDEGLSDPMTGVV